VNAVETLVNSARKRSIANLIAEQATAGLCAALAGFLVLLLAGSDALSWQWLVLLFGGGAAWSAWRTWQGLPSLYEVAQRIDRRLNLSDTISTAIAFATKPDYASENAWQLQRAAAETASTQVTAAQAAPYSMPRQAKWLGGLLIATLALLGLRLGVLGTLDLSHPLVSGLGEYLPAKVADVASNGLVKGQRLPGPGEDPDQPGEDKQQDPLKPEDKKDMNSPQDPQAQQGDNADQQQFGDDQQNPDEMPQNAQDQDGEQNADQNRQGQDSDKEASNKENESESNQQQASNKQSKEQQSLLDKVRDSLSNLMNKMQQQKGGQNNKQNQQQQQQQDKQQGQQADQQGQGQEQSEQSADKQQGASQKDADPNQDKNSASESNQKSASNDPKTGHGTQDGKKDIQQAQKMAEAMGKLTEIIGQRAKTVQGEIMLDRKSSEMHDLKTAYSEKDAFHREAGADLRRDEIPVDLQHYVQQYFVKIRQTPVPPVASAKKQ
jgi:chemotaxis protein histidine kinase CheA